MSEDPETPEESVGEESVSEESVGEESVSEESVGEESVPEKPVNTEPVGDEPAPDRERDEDAESTGATSSHGASGGPIDAGAALALDTGRGLWIPPDATEAETAAIAAAIAAYLSDRERAQESGEEDWAGDRWAFAGRLDALGRDAERVPEGAPRDPWTASGRSDRF